LESVTARNRTAFGYTFLEEASEVTLGAPKVQQTKEREADRNVAI